LIARRVIPIDTTPAGIDVRLDIDTLMSGRVINGYLMHKNDQIGHTYLIAPVAIRNLTSRETRWTEFVSRRLLRFSSFNLDFTTTVERRALSLCRVDVRLRSCQPTAVSSICEEVFTKTLFGPQVAESVEAPRKVSEQAHLHVLVPACT
jgi:hypothetical protein